VVVTTRLLEL